MIEIVRWVGLPIGVFIVAGTFGSVLRTLVLPRGVPSKLSVVVGRRMTYKTFIKVADRFDNYEAKDRILASSAPFSLLAVLVVWLLLFLVGYALILWPLTNGTFLAATREAGSSLLTLGFAGSEGLPVTVIDFAAALTGLVVIALQVGYLPTLYSAFNRRETLVTMLQSRAGAPAWGPELLLRHHAVNLVPNLPSLYADWEHWAADVAESHTNYTVLIWFRSPHPLRSWIVSLLAVMDAAALDLALRPNSAATEARLVIRMGFTCLRYIGDALNVPFDPDPMPDDPIQLTYEEFLGGVERLQEIGFPMERTPEEAWIHFRGWRVNYEEIAYILADAVVAPPGPWSGPRRHLPDMNIVPQRPPDRRPDDESSKVAPKVDRFGWHA